MLEQYKQGSGEQTAEAEHIKNYSEKRSSVIAFVADRLGVPSEKLDGLLSNGNENNAGIEELYSVFLHEGTQGAAGDEDRDEEYSEGTIGKEEERAAENNEEVLKAAQMNLIKFAKEQHLPSPETVTPEQVLAYYNSLENTYKNSPYEWERINAAEILDYMDPVIENWLKAYRDGRATFEDLANLSN